MNCSYIFRTEPSVSITQKVYSLAEAVEFVQNGPSSPQNTMVHFFELFIHTWSSRNDKQKILFFYVYKM